MSEHIVKLADVPNIIVHNAQGQVVLEAEPIEIDYALSFAQSGIDPKDMNKPEHVAQWMGKFVIELNRMALNGHKFNRTEAHKIVTENSKVMEQLAKN